MTLRRNTGYLPFVLILYNRRIYRGLTVTTKVTRITYENNCRL